MNISEPISLYTAVRALECLCAISLLIQTLEFLRLRAATSDAGVWSWQVQRADVAHAPLWLRKVFDALYRDGVHHLHLLLRAGAAASLFAGSSPFSAVLLFASTMLILIRWRGAFNGGSDFMTIVGLTGLVIANTGQPADCPRQFPETEQSARQWSLPHLPPAPETTAAARVLPASEPQLPNTELTDNRWLAVAASYFPLRSPAGTCLERRGLLIPLPCTHADHSCSRIRPGL